MVLSVMATPLLPLLFVGMAAFVAGSSSRSRLLHGTGFFFRGEPGPRVTAGLAAPRKPFMTSFKAVVLLGTCVAILAVDFPAFPRRFAKVETFGSGLMDFGVGAFVLAAGMTSPTARAPPGSPAPPPPLRAVVPLLVLGVARLAATRGVGYQSHVGEYGAHWNFFFTLAAVAAATAMVRVPARWAAAAGAMVLVAHQASLSLFGLSDLIMSTDRDPGSWVSLNKEGLGSLAGYWAIHLIGVSLGGAVFRGASAAAAARGKAGAWWGYVRRLGLLCLALWGAAGAAAAATEPISRRSANAAYVLWVAAHGLSLAWSLLVCDLVMAPVSDSVTDSVSVRDSITDSPALFESLGASQLATFLWANALTGAVNLGLGDTTVVADGPALSIVAAYIAAVCAAPAAAHAAGWRLRA